MGCVWIVRLCYCGFKLAGAALSPTRISHCPDQSSNLHSLAREQSVTHSPTQNLQGLKCVELRQLIFFFLIMTCVCVFPLICYFLLSLRVDLLVGLVTKSSYTELVSTAITSTTLLCWNGLRLLFIVLLLLECSQLYSVSTVPVEPWELHWKPLYHISISDALSLLTSKVYQTLE